MQFFSGVIVFPVGQSVFTQEERAQSQKVQQFESFIEGKGPENVPENQVHENACPEGKEVQENDCPEGKEVHENGRSQ